MDPTKESPPEVLEIYGGKVNAKKIILGVTGTVLAIVGGLYLLMNNSSEEVQKNWISDFEAEIQTMTLEELKALQKLHQYRRNLSLIRQAESVFSAEEIEQIMNAREEVLATEKP